MKAPKATPWVAGTALVAILILAAAWMLGVSPQLDKANVARADTQAAEAQNIVHAQRLAELKEQAEHLDEYKAELAAIQLQVPAEDGLPKLLREIDSAATQAGVFIVMSHPGTAEVFVSAQAAAEPVVVDAPTENSDEEAEANETAEAATDAVVTPTAAPVAGVPGLHAIPFDITVLGTYDNTVRFVGLVQEAFQRLFLVTEFTITGQAAAPAGGGKPEVAEGDAEFLLMGYVYVLQDSTPNAPDGATAEGSTEDAATEDGTTTTDN
jgi:Tfp pilus assembly protein PilO